MSFTIENGDRVHNKNNKFSMCISLGYLQRFIKYFKLKMNSPVSLEIVMRKKIKWGKFLLNYLSFVFPIQPLPLSNSLCAPGD
jgi:hypothetical protein